MIQTSAKIADDSPKAALEAIYTIYSYPAVMYCDPCKDRRKKYHVFYMYIELYSLV